MTFLINFIMDFFLLWGTAKLTRLELNYKRISVSSFIGGLYSVGYLYPSLSFFYSIPVKILVSALLLVIGLAPRGLAEFKRVFLCFYGISFAAAGATVAFYYLGVSHAYINSFSYLYLLSGIFCIVLIGRYGSIYLSKKIIPDLLSFPVKIKLGDDYCSGKGFLDTGNNLRDPLTDKPVLVVEYNFLKNYLPEDFCRIMEESSDDNLMFTRLAASSMAYRLRLIPFTSIGKKKGILVGIRADEVIIDTGDDFLVYKDAVLAIYKDSLHLEGDYKMLIPAEILRAA
nr:sigma-E processing peptidase SpoIIGA [Thermosyntropha lipolytica]